MKMTTEQLLDQVSKLRVEYQVIKKQTRALGGGADVRDAQAQMRHSRVQTTLEIYQQFTPESQRRAVDKLTELTGTARVN